LARTQSPDYEQRREAMVETAADLFATLGFRGASVSDLAKALNTSKSLIYHYYPSKEDVLYAVMASHIDQLVEDVEAVMAREAPARECLSALLHRFMEHYVGAANRQKVLLNELGNLPDDKRRMIVAKQRVIIEAVQSLVVEIHPELRRDPQGARVKTMLLFGMINWTKTWFDPSGTVSASMIADMAFELIAPSANP
jgi:AcrR family transcriptional regulator